MVKKILVINIPPRPVSENMSKQEDTWDMANRHQIPIVVQASISVQEVSRLRIKVYISQNESLTPEMKSSTTHFIHERNGAKSHDDHDSSNSDCCILGLFSIETCICKDVSWVIKYCVDSRQLLRQLHDNGDHERSPEVIVTDDCPHSTPLNDRTWWRAWRVSNTMFILIMLRRRWASIQVLMSWGIGCCLILMIRM